MKANVARGRRRIAFNLAFLDGSALSGPGYYAVQLFQALRRQIVDTRPDLELIGLLRPDARPHFDADCQTALRSVRSPARRSVRVLWEQVVLPWVARRHEVDLLFSPAFVSPCFGAPLLCACVHDMYFAVIPDIGDQRQRRYWQLMVPLTVRRCARILTVSQQTRRDLEAYCVNARGKTVVTPLASRLRADAPGSTPKVEDPFVLMVANLTPNKNVEVVVEGIRQLRDGGLLLTLVHVGADPQHRLAQAVADAGLEAHVTARGKVDDATLVGLYRSAFAVVNASLYEGFGMPAVEAQALGAPLVSSNAGALPEAAGNGALYFDPARPDQLAAHLHHLWEDPDARAALAERGRANAGSYSWSSTAARTLAVFSDLLVDHGV